MLKKKKTDFIKFSSLKFSPVGDGSMPSMLQRPSEIRINVKNI